MWQQIAPKLNISLSIPNLAFFGSLIFKIQGATQPGEPQHTKMQFFQSIWVASPKSKIFTVQQSKEITIFYGFKSRCKIFNLDKYQSPFSNPFIILHLCSEVTILNFRIKFYNVNPQAYSRERQNELSEAQAPQNSMRLGCLSCLKILIQFYSEAQLCGLLKISFVNALTAVRLLVLTSSARQTDAKPPFPNLLIALKNE